MSISDSFGSGQAVVKLTALVSAGILLAACGADSGTTTGDGGSSVVTSRSHPDLGTILVDSGGKTVYFADQEADGEVLCVEECLEFWIPVVATDDTAAAAAEVQELGIVHRTDNDQDQLSYEGKPLYTFRMDDGAGDVSGDNLEDAFGGMTFRWHAVVLSGSGGGQQPQPDPGGGY